MSSELARIRDTQQKVSRMLAPYQNALGELIPRTGVKPGAFMVSLNAAVTRDQNTLDIAMQNPESVLTAGMKCAIWGHVPGSKEAALVAFGGKEPKIEAIEQYHGIINRAQRAAPGLIIGSGVVREHDEFIAPERLGQPIKHNYVTGGPFALRAERGPVIGTWAQAMLPQGTYTQAVMLSEEDTAEIQKLSRTQSFWNKWPKEMRMKAAIKRIRGLPMSSEWRQETDTLMVASGRIAADFGTSVPDMDAEVEVLDPEEETS